MSQEYQAILSDVQNIQTQLRIYDQLLQNISNLHNVIYSQIDENSEVNKGKLDNLAAEIAKLQQGVANKIKQLSTKIKFHDNEHYVHYSAIKDQFLSLIRKQRLIEYNWKLSCRNEVKRQIDLMSLDLSDAQIDDYLADPENEIYQSIFKRYLLSNEDAKMALNEVEHRMKEIKNLEKRMNDLAILFKEMEELVVQQEEPIDKIDTNVEKVVVDLESGITHTEQAIHIAEQKRKNKKLLISIIFYLCAILLLSIFVAVIVTVSLH